MKRIVLWLLSSVSVLALLFSYHTSTSSSFTSGSATTVAAAPVTSSGSTGAAGPDPTGGSTTPSTPSPATVTGDAAATRYGPVQVQIMVAGGTVTSVSVPVYPSQNGEDRQINGQALPILVSETMDAQSASIDMVSGATYTSGGYVQSLQSALDQAGL